jgi:hypothetical protein
MSKRRRADNTMTKKKKDRQHNDQKKEDSTALRRKSKDWLDRNQDNVSEWNDMSISGLLFQFHYKNSTKRVGLVQSVPHHHFIEN